MLVMVNSMTMMMVTVTQIPTVVLIINTLSWAKLSDKQADLHVRFSFSFVSIGAATMMMVSKMVRVVEKLGVGKDNVHVNCQPSILYQPQWLVAPIMTRMVTRVMMIAVKLMHLLVFFAFAIPFAVSGWQDLVLINIMTIILIIALIPIVIRWKSLATGSWWRPQCS